MRIKYLQWNYMHKQECEYKIFKFQVIEKMIICQRWYIIDEQIWVIIDLLTDTLERYLVHSGNVSRIAISSSSEDIKLVKVISQVNIVIMNVDILFIFKQFWKIISD